VFCRQITAGGDGSFYDLDVHMAHVGVTTGHRGRALTCADIHDAADTMAAFGWAGTCAAT
jgi:hypothetical protein